jgi:integrase
MPLKLRAPKEGRTPYYHIRGTYLGVTVERSTRTGDRKVAAKILAGIKDEIERGSFAKAGSVTFAGASVTYMQAGGERRYIEPLLRHFGERSLEQITQADIDAAAVTLYPNANAATRNRQVYTPISAILKRAGFNGRLKRPLGGRGASRVHWLREDEAFALLDAAEALVPRFGALCTFLLYTGCRLQEALRLTPTDLDLPKAFAYLRETKNGEPQPVHLPPQVVAALANLPLDPKRTVFRYTKCGRIYKLLAEAADAAKVTIPEDVAFHLFRHTYGAWMRQHAGLDTAGLVATGRWKSRQAAAVYEHVQASVEARKADLLPTRERAESGQRATEERNAKTKQGVAK